MKYKTSQYEVEGTPLEIREFIHAETKTTNVGNVRGPYKQKKNNNNKQWSIADDKILKENWQQPNGRGDRTKCAHNKKVAKMLGRTYDGTFARFKILRK